MRPDATYSYITFPRVTKKYGQPERPMFRPRLKKDAFQLQPDATEGLPEKLIFVRLVNNSRVSQRPASNNHQSFLCIKNSRHVSRHRPIINNRLSIRLTSQWTGSLHISEWNVFRGDTSCRSINAKYVDSVQHSINTAPSPLHRKARKSVHIFSTRKNVALAVIIQMSTKQGQDLKFYLYRNQPERNHQQSRGLTQRHSRQDINLRGDKLLRQWIVLKQLRCVAPVLRFFCSFRKNFDSSAPSANRAWVL